jgi:hypothetical protein
MEVNCGQRFLTGAIPKPDSAAESAMAEKEWQLTSELRIACFKHQNKPLFKKRGRLCRS